MDKRTHDAQWINDYIAPLKGATITRVGIVEEDCHVYPSLHVRLTNGEEYVLEISNDSMGCNGPGFIHGLPAPVMR